MEKVIIKWKEIDGVGGQNYHYEKNGLTVENILNYIIKKLVRFIKNLQSL